MIICLLIILYLKTSDNTHIVDNRICEWIIPVYNSSYSNIKGTTSTSGISPVDILHSEWSYLSEYYIKKVLNYNIVKRCWYLY